MVDLYVLEAIDSFGWWHRYKYILIIHSLTCSVVHYTLYLHIDRQRKAPS